MNTKIATWWTELLFLVLCSSCFLVPKPAPDPMEDLAITNFTGSNIASIEVDTLDDGKTKDQHIKTPTLSPGQTTRLRVGYYKLLVVKLFATEGEVGEPIETLNIRIAAATQYVVYDAVDVPKVTALPGFRLEPYGTKAHLDAVAHDEENKAAQSRAAAERECSPIIEPPKLKPGGVKVDGHWTCVLGGAGRGTDYVSIVSLAGGKISATLNGADRDGTWSGFVSGDTLYFKLGNLRSGGHLKLDPGGKAMLGEGASLEGYCRTWTMTCTKSRG
jgi:hypothetical protein